VSAQPLPEWMHSEPVRALIPAFALGVAVVAAITDPPRSDADLVLCAVPIAAFAAWTRLPRLPLTTLALAVIVPVVAAQRDGVLEPLLFDVSMLSFVIARWAASLGEAAALGVLAALAPVAASIVQQPSEVTVGIWILGIAFPWAIGRASARQAQLAEQLEATRSELAEQAVEAERRRIARDVHDFVGHGLAAVMLQVTSARHVLHRDPEAAEEALRSAEDVGRRSMRELRRTVALLRSEDDGAVPPPLPRAEEIGALVHDARAGGLAVELRADGELSRIPPGIGVALYRIAQEALANAARHAPAATTVLRVDVAGGWASLVAETTGPTITGAGDPDRPRYGLIGMRERASALGGELTAGPTPEGWRVSCRLPLEATDAIGAVER
jgi:signal transduction histidine kinase